MPLKRIFPKPLAMYSPHLGKLARHLRALERKVYDHTRALNFAERSDEKLTNFHLVKKHQSVLRRATNREVDQSLIGQGDAKRSPSDAKRSPSDAKRSPSDAKRSPSDEKSNHLQSGKIKSLKRAMRSLNGVVIKPGETFSFWHLVKKPSLARGFGVGMQLSAGVAEEGVGGGLCQFSNLIFWLVLHSELRVDERHHHSFDPFRDCNRVLPFASGATVMFPYKDLRFSNHTESTFAFSFWFDKKCLNGKLMASVHQKHSYSVFEKQHAFYKSEKGPRRTNELWRKKRVRQTGEQLGEEFLFKNDAEVKYEPRENNAER